MDSVTKSLCILSSIVIFYLIDFALIKHFDKTRKESGSEGSGRAWDFTFFIVILVSVLVLQPIVIPALSIGVSEIVAYFGLVVIALSIAIHVWSRFHLQHYYAERVEIQTKHAVINTGPYALVRHPVITSFFGISFGIFLINPSLVTIGELVYAVWDFTGAAKAEEVLLSEKLPGYSEYMRKTWKFVPGIW